MQTGNDRSINPNFGDLAFRCVRGATIIGDRVMTPADRRLPTLQGAA